MQVDDDMIRRHLLGGAAESEEEFERRFLDDDDFPHRIQHVRNELLDAYARGELSAEDRSSFERNLLTKLGMRERSIFARALARTTAESRPSRVPRIWLIAAGIAVVLGGGDIWLAASNVRLRAELAQWNSRHAEVATLSAVEPPRAVKMFLPYSPTRGPERLRIKVPEGAEFIGFQLETRDAGAGTISLFDPAGSRILHVARVRESVERGTRFVILWVPSALLGTPGYYRVSMNTTNGDRSYSFELVLNR